MFNEGEGQPGAIQEGAINEGSPSSSETQNPSHSPASGANAGTENVPFHKNPEFQSFLDRQRKNWERDSERKYSAQSEKMKQEFESRYKALESKLNSGSSNMTEENRQALLNLAKLQSSDPEVRKMFGLDRIDELQEKLSKYEQGNVMSQFDSELAEVSKTYADKYGFEPKDVEADLLDFIKDDPLWGRMELSKGLVKKAAKDFFSDKAQELAEREANMKLVNEQKNKGKVSSQKPASGAPQELPPPKSMREAVERASRKEGLTI